MLLLILFTVAVAALGGGVYAFLRFQAQRLAQRMEEEKRHRRDTEHRRRDLDQTCAQVLAQLGEQQRVG